MTSRNVLLWSLTAVSAVASILSGFVLLPAPRAVWFVQHCGYFSILLSACAFVLAALRVWKVQPPRMGRFDAWLLLLALSAGGLWQVHETHGFKVLMDELVLAATGMNMHFEREVLTPLVTHEIDGLAVTVDGVLDKRPLLFPFLLSFTHDLLGYRPENAFVLNAVLSVVLLFLTGRLGRVLGGNDRAGYLALLLLAGVPLVGLCATGGGFDLLNLVLVCGLFLAALGHLRGQRGETQDLLVLAFVLLAQARYESSAFVLLAAACLGLVWWRQRRVVFSWSLAAAPMLLVVVPLQQGVFEVSGNFWRNDWSGSPFGLHYVTDNLGHAVNFLFSWDGHQPGAPLLAGLGGVCLLLALVRLLSGWSRTLQEPERAVFLLGMLVILGNLALLMAYFWGQLDDFVAFRLGLPLLLLFVLATVFILGPKLARPAWGCPACLAAAAWIWIAAIPFAANARSTHAYHRYREVAWERSVVQRRPGRVLFALPSSLSAVVERRAALMVERLAERASEMAFHLRAGTYTEVLVFQRLRLDAGTGNFAPDEESRLGPEFALVPVEEHFIKPDLKERVSRLAGIDLSRAEPRPAGWQPKYPPLRWREPRNAAEEFLRTLP